MQSGLEYTMCAIDSLLERIEKEKNPLDKEILNELIILNRDKKALEADNEKAKIELIVAQASA